MYVYISKMPQEPFWNKYETHKKQLLNVLAGCAVFRLAAA